jgi:prepilin-type N-terminal cleavage/methylation domain-containing protein
MQRSRTNTFHTAGRAAGCPRTDAFTLLEVVTALAILAFASSSVLFVINKCMTTAANSTFQMEAFQIARENMEKLLTSDTLSEQVEYGTSDRYPDIAWRTVVEAFSEPASGQMWVRAVCSAEYIDPAGETQTVELVHWITTLTDQQAEQLLGEEDLETLAAEQLLDTAEDAAGYAGVDAQTIQKWIENGLLVTADGAFIKYNLDIYVRTDGNPTEEERGLQVESIEALALTLQGAGGQTGDESDLGAGNNGVDPATGLPYEQLENRGSEK